MTQTNHASKCILSDFCRNPTECTKLNPHYIAIHGLNGNGGRIASAGLPTEYRYTTLSNSPVKADQPKIYALLDQYVETFGREGERIKSLYLWSESPGTGKTTTASALLNEWIARDYLSALKAGEQPRQFSGLFFDVNEFQTEYNIATMTKDDDKLKHLAERIKRAQQAPFAVLDDIGVRGATDAFRAYIHAIINHRTANGMPTVYTSNLPIGDMATVFDERLYDRIRDQCADIHFAGTSKRGRR